MGALVQVIRWRSSFRLLLFWIIGIMLYVYCPDTWLMPLGIGVWLLLFLWGLLCWVNKVHTLRYTVRWIPAIMYSSLFLMVSVSVCHWNARHGRSLWPGLQERAAACQSELVQRLDSLPLDDAEKSLLATLTLGYRQAMSKEQQRQFATVGVAHVLAVSGFHVGVVCTVLALITHFLCRWHWLRAIRYLFLIIAVWSYVFLIGLPLSAVRAAFMLSFYLKDRLLRQDWSHTLENLFASAFWMLVFDPFYLFDVGFQLSYLSVFFILMLTPLWLSLPYVTNPLLALPWSAFWISLTAQIGTAGLTFFYFKQCSLIFLWTAFPVTLLSSLLLPVTLYWLFLPDWMIRNDLLQEVIVYLTRGLKECVEWFSSFPYTTFRWECDGWDVFAGYLVLLLLLIFLRYRHPNWLIGALSVGLLETLKLLIERLPFSG